MKQKNLYYGWLVIVIKIRHKLYINFYFFFIKYIKIDFYIPI